jgi:hypothetical protein
MRTHPDNFGCGTLSGVTASGLLAWSGLVLGVCWAWTTELLVHTPLVIWCQRRRGPVAAGSPRLVIPAIGDGSG